MGGCHTAGVLESCPDSLAEGEYGFVVVRDGQDICRVMLLLVYFDVKELVRSINGYTVSFREDD